MAGLRSYTTYDDIRAVLGVDKDEVEDTTLSLQVYEFALAADIRAISLTLAADLATVYAKDPSARTSKEAVLAQAATLFATYSVARELLPSLPMLAPKEVSDGKASQTRFALDPYKETGKRVEAQYQRYREALVTAHADFSSTTAAQAPLLPLMRVSVPSSDPVLGT